MTSTWLVLSLVAPCAPRYPRIVASQFHPQEPATTAGEQFFPYRLDLARLCQGVGAAVLLCWLEEEFKGVDVMGYTLEEMCGRLAMRKRQFLQAWSEIGATHKYPSVYWLAKLRGFEFWSSGSKEFKFYSAEIVSNQGPWRIRRNGELIERALMGKMSHWLDGEVPYTPPTQLARDDVRRMLARIYERQI